MSAGKRLDGAPVNRVWIQDYESFVAAYNGSDQHVADYLSEEVVASLRTERRRLLLQLSALEQAIALLNSDDSHDPLTLPDPLTEREREILLYLPTRLSNQDLAHRLFISVNTIKTHIAHIYRKLDVPDRDAAIGRARELGIL